MMMAKVLAGELVAEFVEMRRHLHDLRDGGGFDVGVGLRPLGQVVDRISAEVVGPEGDELSVIGLQLLAGVLNRRALRRERPRELQVAPDAARSRSARRVPWRSRSPTRCRTSCDILRAVVHDAAGEAHDVGRPSQHIAHASRRMPGRADAGDFVPAPGEDFVGGQHAVELDGRRGRTDVARAMHGVLVAERGPPFAELQRRFEQRLLVLRRRDLGVRCGRRGGSPGIVRDDDR